MARTATLLKFTALPGKRDDLVAAFQDEAARAEDNAGIELYLVHTATDEPDAVYLYVAFASEADEEAYTRGDGGRTSDEPHGRICPRPTGTYWPCTSRWQGHAAGI